MDRVATYIGMGICEHIECDFGLYFAQGASCMFQEDDAPKPHGAVLDFTRRERVAVSDLLKLLRTLTSATDVVPSPAAEDFPNCRVS
jgi:hypothetical protein